MRVIDTLRRPGIGIEADRTITDAAELMDRTGVGALAVLDGDAVAGIVTDRDLVRRGLARRLSPDARIDGLMTTPVVTIDAEADLHDAFAQFRTHGIRRLVVMQDGRFAGIVSTDDLLIDLASDLSDLSRPVTAEVVFGHHDSPAPVPTT